MPCRPSKTSAENPTTTEEVIKEHTKTQEVIKDPTTTKEVIKKFGRSMLSIDIALQLNAALQNSFRPYLQDELCVCKRLDEGRLKKYGDYFIQDKHGIVAWAPMVSAKRAIVDFPAQDIDVDGVRSCYIRDAFVHMLEYSGVEVSGKICNDQSLLKCFTAAKGYYEVEDFAADRDFKKHPTMSYLGYETSGDEQAKLFRLWGAFQSYYKEACDSYVGEGMMMASGYSCEQVFECLIKYAYLKTHKYS
ncbi:hypothetical protein Tco_1445315 [Tanacetum coccineum]